MDAMELSSSESADNDGPEVEHGANEPRPFTVSGSNVFTYGAQMLAEYAALMTEIAIGKQPERIWTKAVVEGPVFYRRDQAEEACAAIMKTPMDCAEVDFEPITESRIRVLGTRSKKIMSVCAEDYESQAAKQVVEWCRMYRDEDVSEIKIDTEPHEASKDPLLIDQLKALADDVFEEAWQLQRSAERCWPYA